MNKLAILTTAFNHIDNIYFLHNWKIFCKHISNLKLSEHLYICEVLPCDTTKSIAILENSNHYTVYNDSQIWHKESAINYLLKKLPDKYDYILILDNDVIFENSNWYESIQEKLQSSIMVQPYETIKYLEQNGTDIETYNNSTCYNIQNNKPLFMGNHGMAVSYKREYLEYMNGLFDEAIIGGGDLLNIVPFMYNEEKLCFRLIFEILCNDSISAFVEYSKKAYNFLNQNSKPEKISYLENSSINHLFHGYLFDRQYTNRYNLINKHSLYKIVKKNSDGFYELINSEIENNLKIFFNTRQSLKYLNKPIIVSKSKYGCDNDNVKWLAPCDEIMFRNISRASIAISKHHKIDNIQILVNNTLINIDKLLLENNIELIIDKPKKIEFIGENPPYIENDNRELGLLITGIKIFNESDTDPEEYPLCDVM